MRIIPDNHADACNRSEASGGERRAGLPLDHIGRELRGLLGPVESEPLPDALRLLAARLDHQRKRRDAA